MRSCHSLPAGGAMKAKRFNSLARSRMQLSNISDGVWLILGPLCVVVFLAWADRGLVDLRGKAARNERRRTTAMFLNSLSIAFVIAGLANSFLANDFFALIAFKAGTGF